MLVGSAEDLAQKCFREKYEFEEGGKLINRVFRDFSRNVILKKEGVAIVKKEEMNQKDFRPSHLWVGRGEGEGA